jgi:hypothetical protein
VLAHDDEEGGHATAELLNGLECVNAELHECLEHKVSDQKQGLKSPLEVFFSSPISTLKDNMYAAYGDATEDDEKCRNRLTTMVDSMSPCGCEARGATQRGAVVHLCAMKNKPDVAFMTVRTDLMRYVLSLMTTQKREGDSHFGEKLPFKKVHVDVTKIPEYVDQIVKRWREIYAAAKDFEDCGIRPVPLVYEELEDQYDDYQDALRTMLQQLVAEKHNSRPKGAGGHHCIHAPKNFVFNKTASEDGHTTAVHKSHSHVIAEYVENPLEVMEHFAATAYPTFGEVNKQLLSLGLGSHIRMPHLDVSAKIDMKLAVSHMPDAMHDAYIASHPGAATPKDKHRHARARKGAALRGTGPQDDTSR